MTPQPQPSHERIGSIRQTIYQEDAYLIERVNAGMGEWEYVIRYCGKYYATAPTENIARDIVERAQWSRPAPAALEPEHEQYERICKEVSQEQHDATIRNQTLEAFVKRVRQEFTQDDDEEWYLSAYDFEDCIDEFKNSDGDGDE